MNNKDFGEENSNEKLFERVIKLDISPQKLRKWVNKQNKTQNGNLIKSLSSKNIKETTKLNELLTSEK